MAGWAVKHTYTHTHTHSLSLSLLAPRTPSSFLYISFFLSFSPLLSLSLSLSPPPASLPLHFPNAFSFSFYHTHSLGEYKDIVSYCDRNPYITSFAVSASIYGFRRSGRGRDSMKKKDECVFNLDCSEMYFSSISTIYLRHGMPPKLL